MSKVVTSIGLVRSFGSDGKLTDVYRYVLDCGCPLEIEDKDMQGGPDKILPMLRAAAHRCDKPKALPPPDQNKTTEMTRYAQAVHGYNHSCTVREHGYWTEKINRAWADMTDAEKVAEPFVMDHHYKELVERGLVQVPPPKKALPPPDQDVAKGFLPPEFTAEAIVWLKQRIRHLEQQLDWKNTEYAKLQEIYTKLADQWNAFQSVHKPIQRDVHRAEAAGEMARRLAEMILRLAYHTGNWKDLLEVLNSFSVEDAPKAPQDTPPLLPRWK